MEDEPKTGGQTLPQVKTSSEYSPVIIFQHNSTCNSRIAFLLLALTKRL